MNSCQQKIGFCVHTCPPDCASDPERSTLAEIGKRLGRKAPAQVASVAKPDTILAWYRKLIAYKFDGSKHRRYPGRPRIAPKLEALIVQMAKENPGCRVRKSLVGIPAKLNSIPKRNRTPFRVEGEHRRSESDAGLLIVREVFSFVKNNLCATIRAKRGGRPHARMGGKGRQSLALPRHTEPGARTALRIAVNKRYGVSREYSAFLLWPVV
jgi:hypothetical protein